MDETFGKKYFGTYVNISDFLRRIWNFNLGEVFSTLVADSLQRLEFSSSAWNDKADF